jgi:hypothetical protein
MFLARWSFFLSEGQVVGDYLQDARVLPKLHRRVYLDRVERDELTVYISFYIEVCLNISARVDTMQACLETTSTE